MEGCYLVEGLEIIFEILGGLLEILDNVDNFSLDFNHQKILI